MDNFIARCLAYGAIGIAGIIGVVGVVGMGYAFGFVLSFWSAYVCMHLWNWFVVPAVNLAPISFALMLGLNVAVHAIKGYNFHKDKKEEKKEDESFLEIFKEFAKATSTYLLTYGFAFLTGWIIHTYIM